MHEKVHQCHSLSFMGKMGVRKCKGAGGAGHCKPIQPSTTQFSVWLHQVVTGHCSALNKKQKENKTKLQSSFAQSVQDDHDSVIWLLRDCYSVRRLLSVWDTQDCYRVRF